MKSKKLINLVISTLVGTFITLSGYCGYKVYLNCRYENNIKVQQLQQDNTNKQVLKDWQYKLNQFKVSCNKEEKLLVLSGTVDITNTFTDKDEIVKYQGDDSRIRFLANKLNELKSKSMTVNTEYRFGYTYNLRDFMKVSCDNSMLDIEISKQYLNLQYLDEETNKTTIDTDTHLFSGKFTPQEQQAIMDVTKVKVWNSVISNRDIQDKAIEVARDSITDMGKKFGFDKVNVKVVDSVGNISNQEVKINKIKFEK